LEEMARALARMCGEGARGGLYSVEGALASINAAAEDEQALKSSRINADATRKASMR
jgi:hypothetical protein